ncbi:MAG: GGDEF domain-containing protein [Spirochaetales bacterium]|nr:GGDEF domain-containing protein [Spirochaetales bacterium]
MVSKKRLSDRITIGMLINQLDGLYQTPLWRGVAETAEINDINLIIYTGKSIRSPIGYEAQENIVYQLINVRHLDGIVVTSSSIGNDIGVKQLLEFYKPFRSIPMVSIALAIKGMPSLLTENELGMQEIVNHLVEVHGYKKIAIIKGPETNTEARIRYKAYEYVLKKHNIAIDPELILPGDFRYESGREAVRILLDERKRRDVEAIVSSNDDMATFAYDELKKRGIRIPQDIAVTGFDDIEDVQFYSPPLTTVKQDLNEQGRRACRVLLDMIQGRDVEEIIKIPAKLVIRQSCGCIPMIDYTKTIEQDGNQYAVKIGKNENRKVSAHRTQKLLFDRKYKEYIIKTMLRLLKASDAEKSTCRTGLGKLIDCINSVQNIPEARQDFIKQLISILNKNSLTEAASFDWRKAIAFLRSETLSSLGDHEREQLYENLFHNAQDIPSGVLLRQEAFHKLNLNRANEILRGIMQNANTIFTIEDLMKALADEMPRAGIPRCIIALYNTELECREDNRWILPKNSKLVMAYNENGPVDIKERDQYFNTEKLFPDFVIPKNRRFTFILNALFNCREHFGYILYEPHTHEEVVYIMLRLIISTAIQRVQIFEKQRLSEKKLKITLNELEELNKELHNISIKDELTGLYNRRGFFILGEQHLNLTGRTNAKFLIIFVDFDGLKKINDKYGHLEGDYALVIAAKILLKTFRKSDIVARFGGDEFTIIAANDSMQQYKSMITRLQHNTIGYNKQIKKPYRISLSYGVIEYDPARSKRESQTPSLEDLISMADRELYKQKKSKKKHR